MKKQLLYILTITSAFVMNAQVTLLKDINTGTGNSLPENLTLFNNKIFFGADDSAGTNTPGNLDLGKELWVTDGTETGTTFVKDLRTGTANSSPSFFFSYNNNLYFSANTGSGNVLHITDGTETGTVATGNPFIFNPIELNGLIYYVNTTDSNGLYEFNGTTTTNVADVGAGIENLLGAALIPFNNKIFCYMSYTTDALGLKLYAYDPATDTFTLIKDITDYGANAGISSFTVVGNELYFEAGTGILWKTDGTTLGTVAVTAAATLTGATSLFNWNDKLYFEADNGTSGDQLWVYEPIADTITNLSNIAGDHNPTEYTVLDGYLYYSGQNGTPRYLYRTNGTTIEQVDSTIFDIDDIAVLNGKLFFEGDDGTTGNELYTLDPATLSTTTNQMEIVNVFPNPASDYIMVSKSLINKPYAIYETSGKLVKQGNITSEKIDLNLASGLYLIKITSENNTLTKKILVK